jgi:undecaprenyl-diphosphatase
VAEEAYSMLVHRGIDRLGAGRTSRHRAAGQPIAESALRRESLIVLCVSAVALVIAASAASFEPTSAEISAFRSINGLPQGLHGVVWPFMQYGTFITIPGAAIVALLFHRFRLAFAILLAGVGVYLLALLIKQIVERGRPGALLSRVEERETFGADSLGFPSGHAAVAAALTAVVAAHLSRRWLIAALALGTIVVFGRMYVGAHLPLDVIGGAALGAIAGSAVNLIMRPRRPVYDGD